MTGTTHQMIGLFVALWILITYPVSVGVGLGIMMVVAVMVGSLLPDIDQPTAGIWHRLLGGRLVQRSFGLVSGGHRHFTHSVLGLILLGLGMRYLAMHVLRPDRLDQALLVWVAFMIGYVAHIVADTFTDHGVPWLWPLPLAIKLPPGPPLVRVTTGSFVELLILRGALLVSALLLIIGHWSVVVHFIL